MTQLAMGKIEIHKNTFPELNPSYRLLLGPGPCNVDPRVLRVTSAPQLGHLDPQLFDILGETAELLRWVFQTKNEMTLCVSGSGFSGAEAVLSNLLAEGGGASGKPDDRAWETPGARSARTGLQRSSRHEGLCNGDCRNLHRAAPTAGRVGTHYSCSRCPLRCGRGMWSRRRTHGRRCHEDRRLLCRQPEEPGSAARPGPCHAQRTGGTNHQESQEACAELLPRFAVPRPLLER